MDCAECGDHIDYENSNYCGCCGDDFCNDCMITDNCSNCTEEIWAELLQTHMKTNGMYDIELYNKVQYFGVHTFSLYTLEQEMTFDEVIAEYYRANSKPENKDAQIGQVTWVIEHVSMS